LLRNNKVSKGRDFDFSVADFLLNGRWYTRHILQPALKAGLNLPRDTRYACTFIWALQISPKAGNWLLMPMRLGWQ